MQIEVTVCQHCKNCFSLMIYSYIEFHCLSLQNVALVYMVTIVINHVTDVYLIPVKRHKVTVQTNLDVNLDGNMYSLCK